MIVPSPTGQSASLVSFPRSHWTTFTRVIKIPASKREGDRLGEERGPPPHRTALSGPSVSPRKTTRLDPSRPVGIAVGPIVTYDRLARGRGAGVGRAGERGGGGGDSLRPGPAKEWAAAATRTTLEFMAAATATAGPSRRVAMFAVPE